MDGWIDRWISSKIDRKKNIQIYECRQIDGLLLQLIDADKDKKPVGKKPKDVLEEVERAFFYDSYITQKTSWGETFGKTCPRI